MNNRSFKEILDSHCNNVLDLVRDTIDVIKKAEFQNEQFALNFADILNKYSGEL